MLALAIGLLLPTLVRVKPRSSKISCTYCLKQIGLSARIFANDHGAMVIAEGVERAEEFMTVRNLGVHLVQGFFLHKPSYVAGPKQLQQAVKTA